MSDIRRTTSLAFLNAHLSLEAIASPYSVLAALTKRKIKTCLLDAETSFTLAGHLSQLKN